MIIMIIFGTLFLTFLTMFIIQCVFEYYLNKKNNIEDEIRDNYCFDWRLNDEQKKEKKLLEEKKEKIKDLAYNYDSDKQSWFLGLTILWLVCVLIITLIVGLKNTQFNRNRIRARYEVNVAETQASCVAIQEVKDALLKANAIKEHNEKISRYRLEIKTMKIATQDPFVNIFISKEWNELDENAFKYIGEETPN